MAKKKSKKAHAKKKKNSNYKVANSQKQNNQSNQKAKVKPEIKTDTKQKETPKIYATVPEIKLNVKGTQKQKPLKSNKQNVKTKEKEVNSNTSEEVEIKENKKEENIKKEPKKESEVSKTDSEVEDVLTPFDDFDKVDKKIAKELKQSQEEEVEQKVEPEELSQSIEENEDTKNDVPIEVPIEPEEIDEEENPDDENQEDEGKSDTYEQQDETLEVVTNENKELMDEIPLEQEDEPEESENNDGSEDSDEEDTDNEDEDNMPSGKHYNLIPVSGDSPMEIFRKVLTIASGIVLIVCIVSMVISTFSGTNGKGSPDISNNPVYQFEPAAVMKDSLFPKGIQENFKKLYMTNNDVVATISIDGTNIEQPVVQTKDNKYYENHNIFKAKDEQGNAFVDYNCDVKELGKNTVVYANNNKDGKCPFSPILNYEKIEAFNRNPVISFNTLYNNARWKIYGCFYTTVNKQDDNGYVFDYASQKLNDDNFDGFIKEIDRRKIYKTSVDINKTDKLLMISIPVHNDYFGDREKRVKTRFVIVTRKLRENETEVVVTSKTRYNRRVYKPQAYFDNTGTKNYYKNIKTWNP